MSTHPPGGPPPTQTPTPIPKCLMSHVLGKFWVRVENLGEAMLRVAGSTCLVFCGASFRIVRALEDPIFLAISTLESKGSTEPLDMIASMRKVGYLFGNHRFLTWSQIPAMKVFDAWGSRPGNVCFWCEGIASDERLP